jgi:hypothetical protein
MQKGSIKSAWQKNARDPKRTDCIRSEIAALPFAAHNRLTEQDGASALGAIRGGSDVWRLGSAMG